MPVEALMLWNEPNNLSHYDFELDPEWRIYAEMVRQSGEAIHAENPAVQRILGGISPARAEFIERMDRLGALDAVDVVAIHGFPIDWNHWAIDEWPARVEEIAAVTDLPVWVTEVGVSSFGAEEVQEFGLRRTAELLLDRVPRVHWYSLFDVPQTWPISYRNPEDQGSHYYRHFYMGLIREDGTPKRGVRALADLAPAMGVCQWIHFEDHRLEATADWLRRLGVRRLRTGLSWADSFRPNALEWFDRQMSVLDEFDLTVTFCYTPEHLAIQPNPICTSPPREPERFAEFCAEMVRRYAPGATVHAVVERADSAIAPIPQGAP